MMAMYVRIGAGSANRYSRIVPGVVYETIKSNFDASLCGMGMLVIAFLPPKSMGIYLHRK